jgi:hypothetical protein
MRIWRAGFFVVILCVAQVFAFGQDGAAPEATNDSNPSSAATANPTTLSLPAASATLSQDQIKDLIQKVADNDDKNDKLQRNYTYIEREVEHKLDGKGQTKSTETKTYEILEIYGEQVERLIEKNDKPLSQKENAKEEEKVQKIIDKRRNETDKQREKRLKAEEKDREESRKYVHEISDAYNFSLVGTESVGGREAWVISAEPRPGFVPHLKYANYLSKFHGRVWIDKAGEEVSKMDVECLDTVSWGLFLARLHKGTRFTLEQTLVNGEVWLPQYLSFKLDARVALLKGFKMEDEQTFRDYKKFRTDAKIVGVGEIPPSK